MIRLLVSLALGVTLSLFEYGWTVPMPPLPQAAPRIVPVMAAGEGDEPGLCDPWKMAGGVMIYRCEDDDTGVVCYANGLGMLACVEG